MLCLPCTCECAGYANHWLMFNSELSCIWCHITESVSRPGIAYPPAFLSDDWNIIALTPDRQDKDCVSNETFFRGTHFCFWMPRGRMHSCTVTVLLLVVGVSSIVVDRRQRFPGNYCLTRRPEQCCPGRDDQCTVPIRDTVCYCDQFCAIHSYEDCCPDYEDVCTERPPTTQRTNESKYRYIPLL